MKVIIRNTAFVLLSFVITYYIADYFSQKYFIKTNFNGCVNCHDEMTGFEESHSPEIVGCNACHLGNPNTVNKDFAHKGMILIPGNLTDASKTCGVTACHPGIPERVNSSLMNTMSGVISVNQFTFIRFLFNYISNTLLINFSLILSGTCIFLKSQHLENTT